MKPYRHTLIVLLLLLSRPAYSDLTIEITQGMEGAIPIAVVPFGGNESRRGGAGKYRRDHFLRPQSQRAVCAAARS